MTAWGRWDAKAENPSQRASVTCRWAVEIRAPTLRSGRNFDRLSSLRSVQEAKKVEQDDDDDRHARQPQDDIA